MRKMSLEGSTVSATAARFGQQLYRGWGVGDTECGNGVVLLLSVDDRQVLHTVQKLDEHFALRAGSLLCNHLVCDVFASAHPGLKCSVLRRDSVALAESTSLTS